MRHAVAICLVVVRALKSLETTLLPSLQQPAGADKRVKTRRTRRIPA